MSDFKSISAGALPQTPLGSLQRSSKPLAAVFKGLILREAWGKGDQRGRKGRGKGKAKIGKEKGGRDVSPTMESGSASGGGQGRGER